MPYDSVITIDDDINDYDIDKADDLLDQFVDKDTLLRSIRCWLSHDQFLQFVGDNFGWEAIERDGLHDDEEDDDDEEEEDEYDRSDSDWADGGNSY